MSCWDETLENVKKIISGYEKVGVDILFFRGQKNSTWPLLPGLARDPFLEDEESTLYFDFTTLGSHLIASHVAPWDKLFLMQHHALPTRLLDWTTRFAHALYFAINNWTPNTTTDSVSHPVIWILNPYGLNKVALPRGTSRILYLNESFPAGYVEYFINKKSKLFNAFPAPVVAVADAAANPRMRAQHGVFTLHNDLSILIEETYKQVVHKIEIPVEALDDARTFLVLAGVDDFSLFPDLDGLSNYLKKRTIRMTKF